MSRLGPDRAALSPRARGLVEAFDRSGRIELTTSLWCAGTIAAVLAGFVAVGVYAFTVDVTAGLVMSAVLGLPATGVTVWLCRLLIPRVRVVVDRDGITILRRPSIPWASIGDIDSDRVSSGNGTYRFVRLHLVDEPVGAARRRPTTLPLMLSPGADAQRDALSTLLRRRSPR